MMSLSELFAGELQFEAQSTRKLLEAVPEADFGWKPHEKSFTLQKLASHVAEIPGYAVATLAQDVLVIKRAEYKPFTAASRAELVAALDKNVTAALDCLKGYPDAKWPQIWRMTIDGKTFIEQPRVMAMRTFVMNHLVHHRAQLGVYLRLRDVPLPSVYGPTADVRPM